MQSTTILKHLRLLPFLIGLLIFAMTLIPLTASAGGEGLHFTGVVESARAGLWVIGGREFLVNTDTVFDRGLNLGVVGEVDFVVLPDGSHLATEIETDAPDSIVLVIVMPDGSLVAAPIESED